jgi:putative transposase
MKELPDNHNNQNKSPSLTPGIPLAHRATSLVMTNVESPAPHRGWYSRGQLPHWDHPGMVQSINFRLCDSLPSEVILRWKAELELRSRTSSEHADELRGRMEDYLDAGHGECWLARPELARLVEGALLHFDRIRYRLIAWCVMPNHTHVVIEVMEGHPLGEVVWSWKSYTSLEANKFLGRKGPFWQRDYLDRYVRDAEHLDTVISYVEENPVKAGLVRVKTDWPWSSARYRVQAGILPASVKER